MKSIRVFVSVSDGLEEIQFAVQDLLLQLNRHFKPRDMEFVPTPQGEGPTNGDLALALYWKDFGDLPKADFEKAYETYKASQSPKIYVFFKDSDEGITEALKAFRDSFAEKYGHFYCHFETVDAVKFQLTVQGLSLLPRRQQEEAFRLENSSVFVGKIRIANLNNLPFAALNSKRIALLDEIANGEKRLAECLARQAEMPYSEDAMEAVESVEASLRLARDELARHESILFSAALTFARQQSFHMDESVRRAMDLFNQGRIRDANRLLDLDYLVMKAERDIESYTTAKTSSTSDIEGLLAKAAMVEADYSLSEDQRFSQMDRAYSIAIRLAEAMDDRVTQHDIADKRAHLLQKKGDFKQAETLFLDVLSYEKDLVGEASDDPLAQGVVFALENLYWLYNQIGDTDKALKCLTEAIARTRRLSMAIPDNIGLLARLLSSMSDLLNRSGNKDEAKRTRQEALDLFLPLAEKQPDDWCFWIASILMDMAEEEHDAGSTDAAIDKFREAMVQFRKDNGTIREGCEDMLAHCLERESELLRQGEVKRLDQALRSAEEALSIRRMSCGKESSTDNEADLANSLRQCADLYAEKGCTEKAALLYEEATSRFRNIAARVSTDNLADTNVSLADSLGDFAALYEKAGEYELAEKKHKEAIVLWRIVNSGENDEYNLMSLATSLLALADLHYRHLNAASDALREYGEAIRLYRQLADGDPDGYEPGLAEVCFNYAKVLQSQNLMDDARNLFSEALALRRKLAASNPGEFASELAFSLIGLANLNSQCTRLDEAEAGFSEALALVRKHLSEPDALEPLAARVLCCLALIHIQKGIIVEAETEVKDALLLSRKCEVRSPGSFEKNIQLLEKHLAVILRKTGAATLGVNIVKNMVEAVKDIKLQVRYGLCNDRTLCEDAILFDDILGVPLFLLPRHIDFLQVETAGQEQAPVILSDCFSGAKLYFDSVLKLCINCLFAVQRDRIDSGRCRAFVVCSPITLDTLGDAGGDLLITADSQGVRFCSYDNLVSELCNCFNWDYPSSGDAEATKYEVWLERLPYDKPSSNAKMVGAAMRNIHNTWRSFANAVTAGRKIDLLDPNAQGVLVRDLTKEEAFAIRETLVKSGALASARPMAGNK